MNRISTSAAGPFATKLSNDLRQWAAGVARRAQSFARSTPTALRFIVFTYLFVVGLLLLQTGGLPFGLDNNESFSNAVHARNLSSFPLSESFGLTDESYGATAESGPFVHSHQGNFPRLYTFLLYQVGFVTIEGQIVATALSVGLVAYLLAYVFLQRTFGTRFAVIGSLVFLSNYFLFTQWHLNTYRVWHCFFFFSSLSCVRIFYKRRSMSAVVLTLINFSCLCYWEYVFALFVLVSTAIYALFIGYRRPMDVVRFWLLQAAGGIIAAVTLLTQLSLYMGWPNVLKDIRYTLHARNSALDNQFGIEVFDFFSRHNILFWPNYFYTSGLRTLSRLSESLFVNQLGFYGPTGSFLIMLVVMAAVIQLFTPKAVYRITPGLGNPATGSFDFIRLSKQDLGAGRHVWQLGFPSSLPAIVRETIDLALKFFTAIVGLYLFFDLIVQTFPGIAGADALTTGRLWYLVGISAACMALLTQLASLRRVTWPRLIAASLFVVVAGRLWRTVDTHFNSADLVAWTQRTAPAGGWTLLLVLVPPLALALTILLGPYSFLSRRDGVVVKRMLQFLAAVGVGFVATYFIFTGYIHSGYLLRQNPFLVFATDLGLALALFLFISPIARRVERGKHHFFAMFARRHASGKMALQVAVLTAVAVGIGAAWLNLQLEYLRAIPLDNFAFLKTLKEAPYRGSSFVVTTYAAPVTTKTKSWAIMEPALFSGSIDLTERGFQMTRDDSYKWFADSETNPKYSRPDYSLAIAPTSWAYSQAQYLDHPAGNSASTYLTDSFGLIRRAQEPFKVFLNQQISAIVSEPLPYAIVKLDWDFPAFLSKLPVSAALNDSSAGILDTPFVWHIDVENIGPRGSGTSLVVHDQLGSFQKTTPALLGDGWEATSGVGRTEYKADGSTRATTSILATGDTLNISIPRGSGPGSMRLSINDQVGVFDLDAADTTPLHFEFHKNQALGSGTSRLPAPPGEFAALWRRNGELEVRYRYEHQEGVSESNTAIDVAVSDEQGNWVPVKTVMLVGTGLIPIDLHGYREANPDVVREYERVRSTGDTRSFVQWLADHFEEVPPAADTPGLLSRATEPRGVGETLLPSYRAVTFDLPKGTTGTVMASVRPGTYTKLGPRYPTNLIYISHPDEEFGAVRIEFTLPEGPQPGMIAPLITTGTGSDATLLYLLFDTPTHFRVGFTDQVRLHVRTPPMALRRWRKHTLEVSHPALYPADGFQTQNDSPSLDTLRSRLRVTLDDVDIVSLPASGRPAAWHTVRIGESELDESMSEARFPGSIISAERFWPSIDSPVSTSGRLEEAENGDIELRVLFPKDRRGASEPLMTTGLMGAGDFVYVQYVDDRHIVLGYDHWGVGAVITPPIRIDYNRIQTLRISMANLHPGLGALWPTEAAPLASASERTQVSIDLNGTRVVSFDVTPYHSAPEFVSIGENKIGGSTSGPEFSGTILSIRRLGSGQ